MIQYSQKELISSGDLAKNMNKFLATLKRNHRHKPAIIHNDHPQAVLMAIDEYERLQEAFELLEHMEIYQTLQSRSQTPLNDYLDQDELLSQLNHDGS